MESPYLKCGNPSLKRMCGYIDLNKQEKSEADLAFAMGSFGEIKVDWGFPKKTEV